MKKLSLDRYLDALKARGTAFFDDVERFHVDNRGNAIHDPEGTGISDEKPEAGADFLAADETEAEVSIIVTKPTAQAHRVLAALTISGTPNRAKMNPEIEPGAVLYRLVKDGSGEVKSQSASTAGLHSVGLLFDSKTGVPFMSGYDAKGLRKRVYFK